MTSVYTGDRFLKYNLLTKNVPFVFGRGGQEVARKKTTYYQKDIIFKECVEGHEPQQCVLCVPAFSRSAGGVWWWLWMGNSMGKEDMFALIP